MELDFTTQVKKVSPTPAVQGKTCFNNLPFYCHMLYIVVMQQWVPHRGIQRDQCVSRKKSSQKK